MKFLDAIFKTKMFLVILMLLIIYFFIFAPTGFNRTIMWGIFDKLNYFIKFYFPFILIFYFLTYGILSLLKKKTNKILSIIHTMIIFFSMLILKPKNEDIFVIISLLAFVVFLINIILSLKISTNNIE